MTELTEKEAREILAQGYQEKIKIIPRCNEAKGFLSGLAQGRKEAEGLVHTAEIAVYSVATTDGTKTASQIPPWLRLRLSDLEKALAAYRKAVGKETTAGHECNPYDALCLVCEAAKENGREG